MEVDEVEGGMYRERRCWCCTVLCCCQWWMHQGDDQDVPPYVRIAYLFQQVLSQDAVFQGNALHVLIPILIGHREGT